MANDMNKKKMYLAKLAEFLVTHEMTMSGQELVDHLNRNGFLTTLGEPYKGGRGVYKLINETYNWLDSLGLDDDVARFPKAFVNGNGEYVWDK